MKCVYLVVIGLMLTILSPGAAAQSPSKLVLDYDVPVESCPDADRFSDEVSSKLGFVPWSESGDRLRVRIREENGEFMGTLELPDGSAKILRDSTCPALVGALVSAVSVALDSPSQSAPAAPVLAQPRAVVPQNNPSPIDPEKVTVHVASKDNGLTVSVIDSRMAVVGSNGASAIGISWKELCVAPCTFKLDPGSHEVMISGQGPASSRKLNLVAGNDTYLVAESGSTGLYYGGWVTGLVGVSVMGYGILKLLVPDTDFRTGEQESSKVVPIAFTVGGLAVTGIGWGMMYKSSSQIGEESARPSTQVTTRAISYSGNF